MMSPVGVLPGIGWRLSACAGMIFVAATMLTTGVTVAATRAMAASAAAVSGCPARRGGLGIGTIVVLGLGRLGAGH